MAEKTGNYYTSPIPSMHRRHRRKRKGCSCDSNYAKSLQGICKVISLLLAFITCIIIGTSPYHRPIFVIEGVTWPFHIVMLLTVLLLLVTLGLYVFFLTGQHLEYPQIAWPTVELAFNVTAFFVTLLAVILETSNLWRWDYSRGFPISNANLIGGIGSNGLSSFGFGQGISFTSQLNMNSYCVRYPTECRDYVALLAGQNSYHGNHIFACVLLYILLICFLISSIFAFRTWRVFKREMTNGVVSTRPSKWERFRFRVSEVKLPSAITSIGARVGRLMKRNDDDQDATADVEMMTRGRAKGEDEEIFVDLKEKSYIPSSDRPSSSSHGGHRTDRSRPSSSNHHGGDRTRGSSSSKHRNRDDESHYDSRSSRSARSSRPNKHRTRDDSSHRHKEKDRTLIESKESTFVDSPVASVMC